MRGLLKPEDRELIEDNPLIRNAGRQDNIKGGDTVGSYEEELVVGHFVGVTHLTTIEKVR